MKLNILKYLFITVQVFFLSFPAWSAENKAYVSYLEGTVSKSRNGKDWKPVVKGDALSSGDSVKTDAKSKMELTLPDGSKVRFSENTSLKVESLFLKEEERNFGIRVLFGKVWSKAAKFKKVSKFEIKTANAVAGVKGTTYRIDANEDNSSMVRVYEGEVSVGNLPSGKEDKGRSTSSKYVPGPSEVPEVSREEWTYIVKSWQQITVSPKGVASKPVSFTPEDDKNDWVVWNQEMDNK